MILTSFVLDNLLPHQVPEENLKSKGSAQFKKTYTGVGYQGSRILVFQKNGTPEAFTTNMLIQIILCERQHFRNFD